MSDVIIHVENLGKKYIIGHQVTGGYKTARDQVMNIINNVFIKSKRILRGQQVLEGNEIEEFWALKDLNFEIKRGERIGIIGRNGAGKSTLLKILSRITEPTTGKVLIKGRMASLLEVGTGFHPELTGRENIFLNGAILGMNRVEIKKKFDEIVEFSGIEKFLDTPVKRYSSGMYVRLAFSVAAHLEPEILVVDEVLAVGDTEFQKKCLGKLGSIGSDDGRTILFVSHDLNSIEQLCSKVIYLVNGSVVSIGEPEKVINKYINDTRNYKGSHNLNLSKGVYLEEIKFSKEDISKGSDLKFTLVIKYDNKPKINELCFLLYNSKSIRVGIIDLRENLSESHFKDSQFVYNGVIKAINLVEGEYYWGLYYSINEIHRDIYDLSVVRVKPDIMEGKYKKYETQYRGVIEFDHYIDQS